MFTKLLATLALLTTTIGGASQVRQNPSTVPQTFKVAVGGETFTLAEVDVGTRFDCAAGSAVGIVLKDSKGVSRWSYNLGDTPSYLAIHGCDGASAANAVGVPVLLRATASGVIAVLLGRPGCQC